MKLYLDIETATPTATLEDCRRTPTWGFIKSKVEAKGPPLLIKQMEEYFSVLPLNPQYGIINTIALGWEDKGDIKIISYSISKAEDEELLLRKVLPYLNKPGNTLIGHAIRDFDLPFILRRALRYRLDIKAISPVGLKPWELAIEDTKEKWKMGSYSNTASLKDICACLQIPTPKDDISGKDVSKLFWGKDPKDLKRINTYCAKDVLATMRIDYAMSGLPDIKEENVITKYIIL